MNKVKNKDIIKKILLILIATVILILGGRIFSEAYVVGQTLKLSLNDLEHTYSSSETGQILYCIDHDGHASHNWDATYTVTNYRKIVGKIASNEYGQAVSNGNINAEFAYILGGGNYVKGYGTVGAKTTRQWAVWRKFNAWCTSVGLRKFQEDANSNSNADGLVKEAEDYANSLGTPKEPSVSGNDVIAPNTNVGPFKFDYSENISSITVYDSDGEEITDGLTFTTDKENKNEIERTSIASGQEFYIKNTSDKRIGSLKIDVYTTTIQYNAEIWILDSTGDINQNFMAASTSVDKTTKHADTTVKVITYGSIKINKKDYDTGDSLNAGFKIKTSKGWLAGGEDNYKYDATVGNATIYNSGKIDKLDFGKYSVYEVTAPDGYDLSAQENYDGNNKWVPAGDVEIKPTEEGRKVEMNVINEKVISVSGYVWEDKADYKINDTDNEFKEGDSKIPGVIVQLVNKATNEVIDTKVTDADGQYKFDGHDFTKQVDGHTRHIIRELTITNYYIKFDYSKMQDKAVSEVAYDASNKKLRYIPVAFNSTNAGDIKTNGSRAVMDNVAYEDVNLSGIATTYTGTSEEKTYGLGSKGNLYKKLYDAAPYYTLANINLGIKELPKTDHIITQNLDYIIIRTNGYQYKYDFGKGGKNYDEHDPTVYWQKGARWYNKSVYPSEVVRDSFKGTEGIEAYVTYNISITNTTTLNISELYQEQKLHVTNLEDEFDVNRYTLIDTNWTQTSVNGTTATARYNKIGSGIELGKENTDNTVTLPITFEVKHDAILALLKNQYGINETTPTKAISTAYHEYKRIDYSWENVKNINSIKNSDGNPASHITQNEKRFSEALFLTLELGKDRNIKGNVFKDNVESSATNEILGNGTYEDGENKVKDVQVDLLDATTIDSDNGIDSLQPTSLYRMDGTEAKRVDASVTTDQYGNYNLKGVVPGKYYLRFTYGDGTQKLCDTSGTEIPDDQYSKINVKDYKSTIVTSNATKNTLTGTDTKNGEWYKYLEGDKYSVAVDNMPSVESAQKDMDGRSLSAAQKTPKSFSASTAMTSITIENTIPTSTVITTNTINDGTSPDFTGFNFGIVTRPVTRLVLNKLITNLRLENSQGNIIFDGNPEKGNLTGVSDLDYNENQGSSFTRIEIDQNQLYSSILTISYTITITNNSDVNYYGRNYYWYGEDKVHQVTVTPKDVRDYFDTTLTYISLYDKENDKYLNEYKEKKEFKVEKEDGTKSIKIEKDKQDSTRKLVTINGFNRLYTTKNTNNKPEDCQDFVRIIEQRLLSTNDDDMIMLNTGVMTNVDSTSCDPTAYSDKIIPNDADDSQDLNVVETFYDNIVKDKAIDPTQVYAFKSLDLVSGTTVTITPPTGADKISLVLYIATGLISLAILTVGVVIIKKKVL